MALAQINVDHVWGHIKDPLPENVLKYIDDKTKYHPDGYDKTWLYNKRDALGNRRWDGFNHTFNPTQQTFRRGLLKRITNCLEFNGYQVSVQECGPVEPALTQVNVKLQDGVVRPIDYQAKVRTVVREHKIGIIASPTGTGKSVMMGLICDELRERTLIILNDLVLADQMWRNLGRYFPDAKIGYIGNSEFELGDITVATINSLRVILGIEKRKKGVHDHRQELEAYIKTVGVILHDEVHLADSDSCVRVYDLLAYSPRRYGFSATPYVWAEKQQKYANIELEQVFGHVIYSTFGLDFIALGVKVPLVVRNIEVPSYMQAYGTYRDDQAKLYALCKKFEILENEAWAQAVVNVTREYTENGATAFVYAAHSLAYGERIAALLNAPFVNGKTTRKERFKIFDAVQSRKLMCVVSDIGGVGLDIPSLDAFILASDVTDIRQMAGRVLRASPGKQDGHFVDLWKNTSFLKSHKKKRDTQYASLDAIML
jgi:superfamily II DNA or RNA helicase